jgi:glutathione synthase/RimK-type ligase-like ATP-grasp enzyme
VASTRRTPQTSTGRLLVESLSRYAAARGLTLGRHSHDWILTLTGDGRTRLVHGYDLGVNTSAAAKVASDKSATHDVLAAAGVPSVPHRVFLHPRFLDFVPVAGNWGDLIAAFVAFGGDAVIKDNEGTGGMEVFRVRSVRELEQRTHQLFQIARAVALSPYLKIASERRFVMLGQECLFAYGKERLTVTGDGRRSVGELMGETKSPPSLMLDGVAPDMVPAAGQVVPLQWRHNLGLGARAVPIDPVSAPHARGLAIARGAMAALGLRFASVDIAAVDAPHSEELVMEVNAGVMLEVLARGAAERGENGAALVDAIYHRVLDAA